MKSGASPHLTKIENSKTNQIKPKLNTSLVVLILIKNKNMYSAMYQSRVRILK
jgi:hypothetical protein